VSAAVHGDRLADLSNVEIILSVAINPDGLEIPAQMLKQYAALSDVLLFEAASGMDVQTLFASDQAYWRELFQVKPSLLQADLPAANWPNLLDTYGLAGIGHTGSEEEQTGVKSFDEIEEIFDMLDGLR
jgi:hypothetical protein